MANLDQLDFNDLAREYIDLAGALKPLLVDEAELKIKLREKAVEEDKSIFANDDGVVMVSAPSARRLKARVLVVDESLPKDIRETLVAQGYLRYEEEYTSARAAAVSVKLT